MLCMRIRHLSFLWQFCLLALLLASGWAAAHDGHGLAGAHWHASDLFGLALALAAGAGMVWWRGRK